MNGILAVFAGKRCSMIVEYDVTVLVTATPPRHSASKQVITAVTGCMDIQEVSGLAPAVTLSRYDGTQVRRIFTTPDGDAFEFTREFSPTIFRDGNDGIKFISDYRGAVVQRLRGLPPSVRRLQFHPGSKIVSPEEFGRVEPWESGATDLQMAVVDAARRKVENHLSEYVMMDGGIYRRAVEPFLVLSSDDDGKQFKIGVESDIRVTIAAEGDFNPIACFPLNGAKDARALAASMVEGQRPKVKGDGIKVSEVFPSRLHVDHVAMAFRAAAVRMYRNFVAYAESRGDVEDALTELPIGEILAFRQLSDALLKSWQDMDVIDAAVNACVDYEAKSGREVFTSKIGIASMIRSWNDRPIEFGLSAGGMGMRP
jgi:hypothetical protein